MNRSLWLLSCVCFMIVIGCYGVAQAFDIAIYFDARSGVNWRSQDSDSSFCDTIPFVTVRNNIGAANEQQIYSWFQQMGITHVINYYPFSSDFTDLSHIRHNMKILNASYPGEAFKYMEAQNRNLYVASADSTYSDPANWTLTVGRQVFDQNLNLLVLQADTDTAGIMYRPQTDLGIWNGWKWREAGISGDIYMPMHYRITCNLDTNGTPPGTQAVAEYILFADGNQRFVDRAAVRMLGHLEDWFTSHHSIQDAYVSDSKAVAVAGSVNADFTVGIGAPQAVSFAVSSSVTAGGVARDETKHSARSDTRQTDLSVTAYVNGQGCAGLCFSQPYSSDATRHLVDRHS
jgi:hypothetical protein